MKKTIALLLSIILLFSLAASCGGTTTTSSTPTPTKTATPTPTQSQETEEPASGLPIVADHTSFSLWCARALSAASGLTQWSDADVFKELEKLTNVRADTRHPSSASGTAVEQFNLILVSGDYPDVFIGGTWNGGYDRYIEDDTIIELGDLLAEYGPNITAKMGLSEVLRRSCITDSGKYPMIPLVQYQSLIGPTAGLCIRGDWLDEQGIDIKSIVTYDDLRDTLDVMKTAYNLQYPYGFATIAQVFSGNVSRVYTYGFNAAPSFIYDANGNMAFGPMQQEYRDFLITYNGMVQDGYINPDVDALTRNDMEAEWYNDKIAFGFGMAYYIGSTAATKGVVENPNFKIVGIDEPKYYEGIELHTGEYHQYNADNYTLNSNITITTACKAPDVVMRWFDYCFSEDGILLTNYGFEGDTFTYVNGKPTWTDKIANNLDMPDVSATQQRYLWHFPPFTDFDKEIATYPDDAQREAITTWQSSSDHAWCLPLNYTFTAEESSEYSGIYGDLSTYVLESTSRFLAGIQDPNDDAQWEAYVNQIKGLKVDRVLELVDAACDRCLNR